MVTEIERLPDDVLLPVELIEAGRTDEAIEQLAAEDAPEAEVNLLGYALLTAGHHDEAVALFRWNAERFPTHANPWDSLADGLRLETKEIAVPPEERVLNVEIEPSAEEYQPGEEATIKVRLTDGQVGRVKEVLTAG